MLGNYAETKFTTKLNQTFYLLLTTDINSTGFLVTQLLEDEYNNIDTFTDIRDAIKCYCKQLEVIGDNVLFTIESSEFKNIETTELINFKKEVELITEKNNLTL
ncbi:hypothetical protein PL92145975 [Planktothrix tepida PCC 9214]|uniref:Uncharacterized protein n=1 Tax=Planktothrix tepida PCC 9214 TaxID=671072 RepID=A0A1J1LUA5_9CYAN|nr:hypothetical protein [Planktothrix tepida]CUR36187.1 hypothetical protein PL92145975 [Planktothrix tepida PCC 9214]